MSVSKRPTLAKPPGAVAASVQSVMTPTGPPCKGRSVKKLQTFMKYIGNDTTKINILLARALLNDDMLDAFDGYPHANECAFSYPDSDWFSVYLLDEDGNPSWDPDAGHAKLYFKIDIDGEDANIDQDSMTNETPDELIDPNTGMEYANCVVSGSSCTGTRPKIKAPKATAAKAVGRPPSAKPVGRPPSAAKVAAAKVAMPSPLVAPDILSGLETLSIASGGSAKPGGKGPEKITRDYFEEMKSKDVIVDWMMKNMSRADLIKCIEKGALSAADVAEAQELADIEPSFEAAGVPEEVVVAAESMPESEFKKMLKKATKETIKETLNAIKDPVDKKNAIVDLCTRSGVPGYSVRANKKGIMKIIDPEDEPIDEGDINQLLDTCAISESMRLKAVIDRLRKTHSRATIRTALLESSRPVAEEAITLQSIIAQIMAIGSLDDKKRAIADLCARSGNTGNYIAKNNKKGILKIFDSDDEAVDDGEIDRVLGECAADEFRRLNASTEFGKSRKSRKSGSQQNKFALAAKKCKGKPNFRKCMSKQLSSFGKKKIVNRVRKITGGSKYVSKSRKSPEVSATTQKVGKIKTGNDGNDWVVKKSSNGVKRWVKLK